MVSSKAVSWKVRTRIGVRSGVQGTVLFVVIMLGLFLCAVPPAFAAGGTCPSGNNTIDPQGNPISISNVGITGTITGSITGCYYISKATGSDSNTGTDEAHPWAHLPGMPSCTGTCNSHNPAAGEGFILRGGDTWTSGDLGITWLWNGTSNHPIYVGVDQSWFNAGCGASWCRPIFNATGLSADIFNLINGTWIIIDNIEIKGMTNADNGCRMESGTNERCTQLYFHAWTHAAIGSNNVGFFSQCGPGSMIDHNVMDGSDSSKNTMNGVFSSCAGTIQYNYFNYVVSGILASIDNVNNNIVENSVDSADGDHCNGIFTFAPASGSTTYVYNNITRKMICSGGVNFWLNGNNGGSCSKCTAYAYNNIIDASAASGNVFNIGDHPSAQQGTYYVYNNTVIANNGGSCMGNGEGPPRSTTNLENNHCIGTSIVCDGTGTTCNNLGGNLSQTIAQANANTSPHFDQYTSSESQEYSPVVSTNSTVGAGNNLSSSCSGSVTALCDSITYPVYNSTNHTMGVRASNARSISAAWDIGAYLYASGSTPNPPTGLAALVQ